MAEYEAQMFMNSFRFVVRTMDVLHLANNMKISVVLLLGQ